MVWYWEETPVVSRPGRAVRTLSGDAWFWGPQGGRGCRQGPGRGWGTVSERKAQSEEKGFAPSKLIYSLRSRPILIPFPYPPLRVLCCPSRWPPQRPRPYGPSRACCGEPRSPCPLCSRGRLACSRCRCSRRVRCSRACLRAPLLAHLELHVLGRAQLHCREGASGRAGGEGARVLASS